MGFLQDVDEALQPAAKRLRAAAAVGAATPKASLRRCIGASNFRWILRFSWWISRWILGWILDEFRDEFWCEFRVIFGWIVRTLIVVRIFLVLSTRQNHPCNRPIWWSKMQQSPQIGKFKKMTIQKNHWNDGEEHSPKIHPINHLKIILKFTLNSPLGEFTPISVYPSQY